MRKIPEGFLERTDQRPINQKLYIKESFMQILRRRTLLQLLLESLQLFVKPLQGTCWF